MMFKRMAMRCHGSSIYVTLPMVLFTGCQSNVNLPKQPPDKVVEKEQVIRTYTAQTVNNKSDTQQDTATKVIAREREQVSDAAHVPLQDSTSTVVPINTDKDFTQDGVVDTDEKSLEMETEQEMITNMLYSRGTESVHSSDDGNTEQDYAALNASTEEEKGVLDQLEKDVVHNAQVVILGIPGSTQE